MHRYNQLAPIFTILWEHSGENFLLELPSLICNDKVTCENFATEITKIILARRTKRCSIGTVVWAKCPNFSTRSPADLNFHFAKKRSSSQTKTIKSVNFRTKILLAFFLCDYTDKKCTTDTVYRRPKMWMWHSCWHRLTMRVLGKNSKKASNFLWTLRWRVGDIESSVMSWTYWMHTLWAKNKRHCSKSQGVQQS